MIRSDRGGCKACLFRGTSLDAEVKWERNGRSIVPFVGYAAVIFKAAADSSRLAANAPNVIPQGQSAQRRNAMIFVRWNPLTRGSKAKIRNIMSALYSHAIMCKMVFAYSNSQKRPISSESESCSISCVRTQYGRTTL